MSAKVKTRNEREQEKQLKQLYNKIAEQILNGELNQWKVFTDYCDNHGKKPFSECGKFLYFVTKLNDTNPVVVQCPKCGKKNKRRFISKKELYEYVQERTNETFNAIMKNYQGNSENNSQENSEAQGQLPTT